MWEDSARISPTFQKDGMCPVAGAHNAAREAIMRLWPQSVPESAIRREVALLLLEDPDCRLRMNHVEEIVRGRLPDLVTEASELQPMLRDATTARFLTVESAGDGSWPFVVLRLNVQEMVQDANQGRAGMDAKVGEPEQLPKYDPPQATSLKIPPLTFAETNVADSTTNSVEQLKAGAAAPPPEPVNAECILSTDLGAIAAASLATIQGWATQSPPLPQGTRSGAGAAVQEGGEPLSELAAATRPVHLPSFPSFLFDTSGPSSSSDIFCEDEIFKAELPGDVNPKKLCKPPVWATLTDFPVLQHCSPGFTIGPCGTMLPPSELSCYLGSDHLHSASPPLLSQSLGLGPADVFHIWNSSAGARRQPSGAQVAPTGGARSGPSLHHADTNNQWRAGSLELPSSCGASFLGDLPMPPFSSVPGMGGSSWPAGVRAPHTELSGGAVLSRLPLKEQAPVDSAYPIQAAPADSYSKAVGRSAAAARTGMSDSSPQSPPSAASEDVNDEGGANDMDMDLKMDSALEAIIAFEAASPFKQPVSNMTTAKAAATAPVPVPIPIPRQDGAGGSFGTASPVSGTAQQQHSSLPMSGWSAEALKEALNACGAARTVPSPMEPAVGRRTSAGGASSFSHGSPPISGWSVAAMHEALISGQGFPPASTEAPAMAGAAAAAAAAAWPKGSPPSGWSAAALQEAFSAFSSMPMIPPVGASHSHLLPPHLQQHQRQQLMNPSYPVSSPCFPGAEAFGLSPPTAKAAAAKFIAAIASMATANNALGQGPPGQAPNNLWAVPTSWPPPPPPQFMMGFPPEATSMLTHLPPRIIDEVIALVRTVPGLKLEDFDDGVLYQLCSKRCEEEAIAALRSLGGSNLANMQHKSAFVRNTIKTFRLYSQGNVVAQAAANSSNRSNNTAMSAQVTLQKLPPKVYRRLEELIGHGMYIDWKHFDAGVVKVMVQLSEIGEADMLEELDMLDGADLSNVEYMPAYLNKRLNNRLWSRRKAMSGGGGCM